MDERESGCDNEKDFQGKRWLLIPSYKRKGRKTFREILIYNITPATARSWEKGI